MDQLPNTRLNINYRVYKTLQVMGHPVKVEDFIVTDIRDDEKWDEAVKIYFRETRIPKN